MSIRYVLIGLLALLLIGISLRGDISQSDKPTFKETCVDPYPVIEYEKIPLYDSDEICNEQIYYKPCKESVLPNGTCAKSSYHCANVTWLSGWRYNNITKWRCSYINNTIKYKDVVYEFNDKGCTDKGTYLLCDSKEDGNGDGICQKGETCYKYAYNNKLELYEQWNGEKVLLR